MPSTLYLEFPYLKYSTDVVFVVQYIFIHNTYHNTHHSTHQDTHRITPHTTHHPDANGTLWLCSVAGRRYKLTTAATISQETQSYVGRPL